MALLILDGFDGYANLADASNQYAMTGQFVSFSTTAGRFGGCALTASWGGNAYAVLNGWGSATELWFGCAINVGAGQSANTMIGFSGSGGVEATLAIDLSTGTLKAYRGRLGTLLGSSATSVLAANAWRWIEVHFKLDGSTGIFEVWLDDVQVLNLTGQNTKNSTSTTITGLIIGDPSSGSNAITIDDMYLLDTSGAAPVNTRLGDLRISMVVPTSDASPNNGTPSSGTNHYSRVSEGPGWDGDTSYITLMNTTGQREMFGLSALPTTPDKIIAVTPTFAARKTEAGTASAHSVVKSGAIAVNGASKSLSTSYVGYRDTPLPNDPNTGAPWTAAAVAALQAGYAVE